YGTRGPMKLYVNDQDGRFHDRTEEAGLNGLYGGLNTVHADYDNDGFVDVFVLRGAWLGDAGAHPNSLIRNKGDGTFEDVTLRAGVLSYHPTQTAAWADFNNDGWIDLFVGNESDQEINVFTGDLSKQSTPHPSELFINNGDGTFSEISAHVGIDVHAYVKAAVWGDVNNDGLQDLYLSVMGGPNRLYINRGGIDRSSWTFEERAEATGVDEPFFSFPSWFWDYDNDGDQDIFVSSYDSRHFTRMGYDVAAEYLNLPVTVEQSRLYRNRGDGTFEDVTEEAALDKLMYTMGSNFGDLDNDGYLDFYLGTGGIDLFSLMPNRMFHNSVGERFDEVTFEGGFGHIQKGHGVAFGDLDNDGDQDIYSVMGGALEGDVFQNLLFENPGHDNAWISLQLQGVASNRDAIGARIRLKLVNRDGSRSTIYATVSTGGSFGASSLRQEIGLGDATEIEEIEVVWPNADRSTQAFADLDVNRHFNIIEGESPVLLSPKRVTFRQTMRNVGHHGTSDVGNR
ncbi:MAG: CRTAC1 family protein, partial [Rhodothermia bacterium]|nr:CRTAC1 family protein [Rhodothermia bacterium]